MSKAAYWGLIGLAVGATTYVLLMWVAKRNEREAKTQEEMNSIMALKILATANLILIPSMMYWLGGQSVN